MTAVFCTLLDFKRSWETCLIKLYTISPQGGKRYKEVLLHYDQIDIY